MDILKGRSVKASLILTAYLNSAQQQAIADPPVVGGFTEDLVRLASDVEHDQDVAVGAC
jgi:hypothetical protein